MFFRGQEVVCIGVIPRVSVEGLPIPDDVIVPVKDQILRIRDIVEFSRFMCFLFHEIHNPMSKFGYEWNFVSDGFRPLIRLKDEKKIRIKEKV